VATALETWFCEEVRRVIRFVWAKHVSPIEIHPSVDRRVWYWRNDSVSCQIWCSELEYDRISMTMIALAGRPHQGRIST